jgi:hypothetical protein
MTTPPTISMTLQTTTTPMSYKAKNKKSPPPWRTSEAKEILRLLLQEDSDNVWHHLDPREIYEMSPVRCFKNTTKIDLANFRSLKLSIQKERTLLRLTKLLFSMIDSSSQ